MIAKVFKNYTDVKIFSKAAFVGSLLYEEIQWFKRITGFEEDKLKL